GLDRRDDALQPHRRDHGRVRQRVPPGAGNHVAPEALERLDAAWRTRGLDEPVPGQQRIDGTAGRARETHDAIGVLAWGGQALGSPRAQLLAQHAGAERAVAATALACDGHGLVSCHVHSLHALAIAAQGTMPVTALARALRSSGPSPACSLRRTL